MNKLIIFAATGLFLSLINLYADSALFLTTTPMGAEIVVDGSTLSQKTPVLLRNLSLAPHKIELSKLGYKSIILDINPGNNEVLILKPQLEYRYIPIIFPTYNNILINEQLNNKDMLLLKDGSYKFSMAPDELRIIPEYPGQRIINGLNISIPLLAMFSGALTVNEIYNPRASNVTLSPFTLSSFGLNAALIITDIILYIGRNKFYREFTPPVVAIESEYPESLYKTSNGMISAGKFDKALYYLNKIINQFPASDLFPKALYKIAKIKVIQEDTNSALDLFNKIIRDYPLPELYNSSEKSLAEIYSRMGDYQKSLDHLNLILVMETGFSREEIDLEMYKILSKWYGEDSSKGIQLKSHLEYMINTYGNSSNYEFYVTLLSRLNQNVDIEN
ncbi:MAG: tetratricopeptide repeat protein [Spirochaetaceae bacterium]|nr:tetratricopeptide repeat protein [Spirochaetaceae bacterium]